MCRSLLPAVFSTLLLCPQVFADQIILKNGDRLTGSIIKSDAENLTIDTEYAGPVNVKIDAIEQISSEQPLYLSLRDSHMLIGALSTVAGAIEVRTADMGTVTIRRDAIEVIRSKDEQAKYQAELDRHRNPGLLDLWSGSADLGLSLSRGNADTATLNTGMNVARVTGRDKIGAYVTSLYATNSTTGKAVTTANAIRGGAQYDVNITDRHYAFGKGDLEFDEFQKLDLRLLLGGGLGWHVKKTEHTLFSIFGGGSVNKEYFSTGEDRSSGEIIIGQEASRRISRRASFKERFEFLPNTNESGEYRIAFDASAVTNLNSWLAWHVTVSDRFLSNPIPGTKKNDMLLSTGFRITFGR